MEPKSSFLKLETISYLIFETFPKDQGTATEDSNIHFIHCYSMEDNQDILNLVHNFWSKFSNSNQINWDWMLKGWVNKSKIRRLHTKEFKEYD
jgi:hypothetical protein